MALSLSKGFRSFKEGLDKKLVWAYWLAVKEEAWAILWGAGVVGVPITIITLYTSPSWKVLGWIAAWCFLVAGYYVWRADHVRLQKRITLTGVESHSWQLTEALAATQYYFGLQNDSEALTIRNVRVQLSDIRPKCDDLQWLPVFLHHQHDAPSKHEDSAKVFDLHPKEIKNIDLALAAFSSGHFRISHVSGFPGTGNTVSASSPRVLTVKITAEDAPVQYVDFSVWFGEDGAPKCEIRP